MVGTHSKPCRGQMSHLKMNFTLGKFILYYITRIIKNIFNKNDSICRDVKTQKVCGQGWDG